jgi:hypothetical protein
MDDLETRTYYTTGFSGVRCLANCARVSCSRNKDKIADVGNLYQTDYSDRCPHFEERKSDEEQ